MKRPRKQIRRFGVIANSDKVSCVGVVKQAARLIVAAGERLYSEPITAQWAGLEGTTCPDAETLARQVDVLLVFGGDGTMLRVAREIAGCQTPILGVNIGGLGFLTAVSSDDLSRALKRIRAGEFSFESRALVQARVKSSGRLIEHAALNDIVISRGIASRLIELEVRVNRDPLTTYRCDGLIVSSPTGSTAYSLAAGGALVFPTAPVFQITPICPHTLSNRSLIIPLTALVEVRVVTPKPETILSADGQVIAELLTGDQITIQRSRRTVRLMHLQGSSFCDTLRRKLHWRGTSL